jgi:hypothetical protein
MRGEIEGVVIARMLYVLFLRTTNVGSETKIHRDTLSYTSRTDDQPKRLDWKAAMKRLPLKARKQKSAPCKWFLMGVTWRTRNGGAYVLRLGPQTLLC